MTEGIVVALIGGSITIVLAALGVAWTLGGVRRDVQRHSHLLSNGLISQVHDNAKGIAVLMEHQKAQDACLRRIATDLGRVTTALDRIDGRLDGLPRHAAPKPPCSP